MDANALDEEAGLPGNPRAQRPRSSVPSFLFISFMLFMLTSHNGDEFLARHQYQDALQSLSYQLSNYTSWMNGTASNFTLPERDPTLPPLLDTFHVQGRLLDPTRESYYSNVTGFIHGNAEFNNITLPALRSNETLPWKQQGENYMAGVNTTDLAERLGSWRWNTSTKVALSVVEKKPPGVDQHPLPTTSVTLVHGRIELTDPLDSENLRLEFEGVHFISNGSIYGFAEPAGRPIDIRMLPSLVPEVVRNETARIIEPELQARIDKLKNLIDAGIIDSEALANDEAPKTTCPFTFHAQIHPVAVPEHLMQELESELQNPTGIRTVPPPKLSISGILLSRECGILYEVTRTEGLRSRTFFRKVTTYAGLTAITYLAILILLSRQTERSRTPSGISRVSRWTFLAQATMDSVSFAGHITFAILAEGRPSLSLIAPAFLACVIFTYEAQFSALIHQIQGPENYTPPPPPTANTPTGTTAAVTSPSQQPLLPISSLTTSNPSPPPDNTQQPTNIIQAANNNSPASFFSFLIHHIRTDPQAKMWVTLVIFLTFIVRVILSPMLSMLFVAVTYSGIWLPQIVRSVRRGRSSGLSKEYILGTTACRLFSALYFLGCPKNVLEVEPRAWIWILAVIVVLQALVVILQDTLGPTFFLPERFAHVKSYDYHPPMPLPDSESPEQSLGDCAICMDAIMVDPALRRRSKSFDVRENWDEKGTSATRLKKGKSVGSVLSAMQMGVGATSARKNYSLAPCSHLFHTECLEKWLAIKNICPQCRRPLPPL